MPRKLCKEADVLLAIDSIKRGEFRSSREAGLVLGVPHTTIDRRMKGTLAREDSSANRKKLTKWEEEVLTERILDLDARAFSPNYEEVAAMANVLIDDNPRVGRAHVGKNWAERFVKQSDVLKTK
jgi:hypothetical protein